MRLPVYFDLSIVKKKHSPIERIEHNNARVYKREKERALLVSISQFQTSSFTRRRCSTIARVFLAIAVTLRKCAHTRTVSSK